MKFKISMFEYNCEKKYLVGAWDFVVSFWIFSLIFREGTIQIEILDQFLTLFEQGNWVQDLTLGMCWF